MKKVYVVVDAVWKNKEVVDVNIVKVCKTKAEAEKLLLTLNPFTAKIKESYMA